MNYLTSAYCFNYQTTNTNLYYHNLTYTPTTTAFSFPPNTITQLIWRDVEIKNMCKKSSAWNCSLKDYKKIGVLVYV